MSRGESQLAGRGELLRREGYTGGHGATSVNEKEDDETHELEEKRESGA